MNFPLVKDVGGYSEGNSNEPKKISEEFTRVPGSEPHFHDVDGAYPWRLVMQKVRESSQTSTRSSLSSSGWNNSGWDRTESVSRLAGMTKKLQLKFELFKVIAQGPL